MGRSSCMSGLGQVHMEESVKALPSDTVDKLRKMLAYLENMENLEELWALPGWKVHTLTGDRRGAWSLSVTRNRRLTFRIDIKEGKIFDVDLEDYH
jgi:proteic killer suppression protein